MKYSGIPTWIGAGIISLLQIFVETEKIATDSTIYFVGIIILVSISITIFLAKEKK